MTEEIRKKANELSERIRKLEKELSDIKIMIENKHEIQVMSGNTSFSCKIPKGKSSQEILKIARKHVSSTLKQLKKEYEQL